MSRSCAKVIQVKEKLQGLKKRRLFVNEYMLKVKLLTDDLEAIDYGISEEEKLISVLGGLDENYDSVFSIITEHMIHEKITADDAKSLLQIHKCRLERRRVFIVTQFPFVDISVKND